MAIVSLLANTKEEAQRAVQDMDWALPISPLELLWKFLTFRISGAAYCSATKEFVVFERYDLEEYA